MVVDDGERDQADVQHLEQVLVLEVLVGRDQPRRGAPGRHQAPVQGLEARPVAARAADPDLPAGQVVEGRDLRRGRPGDHDLPDVLEVGLGEVDLGPALGRDRQVGGDEVALARQQGRDQAVAADRDEVDGHLRRALGALPLAQEGLERAHVLVGDAAGLGAVDEEAGPAVGGQHADDALLEHDVEVAAVGAAVEERLELGRRGRRPRAGRGQARGSAGRDGAERGEGHQGAAGQARHPLSSPGRPGRKGKGANASRDGGACRWA